jgi:hypothetical protein
MTHHWLLKNWATTCKQMFLGGYITAVAICTKNKITWKFWSVYWLLPLMLHNSSHTVSVLLLNKQSKCNTWPQPVAIWVMLLADNIIRNKYNTENYHHNARCMRQDELVFWRVINDISEWWHRKSDTNHSPPLSANGQEGQGWQWGAPANL